MIKLNEHYFSKKPTSETVEKDFQMVVDRTRLYFKSVSGVFSFGKPDRASLVLIYNFPQFKGDLLDLGCGYGLVGVSLKATRSDVNLFMSDVNERAVKYARINAKNNNANAVIESGDGFEPWKAVEFDTIAFNPPIAAGKRVWAELIGQSPQHLKENGMLVCVGFHNKAGKTIEREMKTVFGSVFTVVKDGGVRVYLSRKE